MPDLLEAPPSAPTPEQRSPSPALEDFDKTFADLDTAPTPEPAPASPEPTPTPEPKAEPSRPKDPETGKFVKAEPKPEPAKVPEKPAVEPPKPAQAPEFEPPQVAKPSELRGWARRMGTRAEQAERQLSQLNAKVRELESRQPQQSDTRALTEELATYKKRLEERDTEIKAVRYERSEEYREKFEKPYQNAVKSAYAEVRELLVSTPNPNDPDNPQERQATPQDFDEVYNLPLGPATKLAKAKFGDAASIVIQHVKAIKDSARAAVQAIEDHKGQAAQFEQQQTAQQKMLEEGRSRMFSEAIQSINQKYPTLFGEREGDDTWNQNLTKGRHMADLAFSDRQGLTPVQSAMLDAQIHARVSGYPALRAEVDKIKAERDAFKKEVEELRGSSPGKPSPTAPKAENGTERLTMEQAFDKFVPE